MHYCKLLKNMYCSQLFNNGNINRETWRITRGRKPRHDSRCSKKILSSFCLPFSFISLVTSAGAKHRRCKSGQKLQLRLISLFTHKEINWVRNKMNKKRQLCKISSEFWEEGEESVSRTLITLTVPWLWVFFGTLQQKLERMLSDRFVGGYARKCAGNSIRLREKGARVRTVGL